VPAGLAAPAAAVGLAGTAVDAGILGIGVGVGVTVGAQATVSTTINITRTISQRLKGSSF